MNISKPSIFYFASLMYRSDSNHGNNQWWMRGMMSTKTACSVVTLLRDIASVCIVYSIHTLTCSWLVVSYLTKLIDECRRNLHFTIRSDAVSRAGYRICGDRRCCLTSVSTSVSCQNWLRLASKTSAGVNT
jgi:putative exporter of polyketide antibiotics